MSEIYLGQYNDWKRYILTGSWNCSQYNMEVTGVDMNIKIYKEFKELRNKFIPTIDHNTLAVTNALSSLTQSFSDLKDDLLSKVSQIVTSNSASEPIINNQQETTTQYYDIFNPNSTRNKNQSKRDFHMPSNLFPLILWRAWHGNSLLLGQKIALKHCLGKFLPYQKEKNYFSRGKKLMNALLAKKSIGNFADDDFSDEVFCFCFNELIKDIPSEQLKNKDLQQIRYLTWYGYLPKDQILHVENVGDFDDVDDDIDLE